MVRERVNLVVSFVLAEWLAAARAHLHAAACLHVAEQHVDMIGVEFWQEDGAMLHQHLFWSQATTRIMPMPVPMLTVGVTRVSHAYAAIGIVRLCRRNYIAKTAGIVHGDAETPLEMVPHMYGLFAKPLKLGWHNGTKVVLWLCLMGCV